MGRRTEPSVESQPEERSSSRRDSQSSRWNKANILVKSTSSGDHSAVLQSMDNRLVEAAAAKANKTGTFAFRESTQSAGLWDLLQIMGGNDEYYLKLKYVQQFEENGADAAVKWLRNKLGTKIESRDDKAVTVSQVDITAEESTIARSASPSRRRGTKKEFRRQQSMQRLRASGSHQTAAILEQIHSKFEAEEKDFMLDPRTSTFLGAWDWMCAVALIFTATITPYEVAFLPPSNSPLDQLFLMNRCVDVIFIMDMLLQFRIMFPTQGNNGQEIWIKDPKITSIHYAKTWFVPDLATILPSAFDILPFLVPNFAEASKVKAFRVMRVLRLLKLARLVKASKVLKRLQVSVALPFTTLTMVELVCTVMIISHWAACVLGLLATPPFTDSLVNSWMSTFGHCTPEHCRSPLDLYGASFDWSLSLIVGEREPSHGPFEPSCVAPFEADYAPWSCDGWLNGPERVVRTVLMVLYAFMWTYITAVFVETLANANPGPKEMRMQLNDLNFLLKEHNMKDSDRRKLREYLYATVHVQKAEKTKAVLNFLSPGLRELVANQANSEWFNKIPLFTDSEHKDDPQYMRFQAKVALNLMAVVLPQGEWCDTNHLYVVRTGTMLHGRGILGRGRTFGLTSLVDVKHIPPSRGYSLTYVELLKIEGQLLKQLAWEESPAIYRRIKLYVTWRTSVEKAIARIRVLKRMAIGKEERPEHARKPTEAWRDLLVLLQNEKGDFFEGKSMSLVSKLKLGAVRFRAQARDSRDSISDETLGGAWRPLFVAATSLAASGDSAAAEDLGNGESAEEKSAATKELAQTVSTAIADALQGLKSEQEQERRAIKEEQEQQRHAFELAIQRLERLQAAPAAVNVPAPTAEPPPAQVPSRSKSEKGAPVPAVVVAVDAEPPIIRMRSAPPASQAGARAAANAEKLTFRL